MSVGHLTILTILKKQLKVQIKLTFSTHKKEKENDWPEIRLT